MRMRNKILAVVAAVVGLGLAAAIAAAIFVDVDRFRPELQDAMSSAAGRKVQIGHVSLSLLSRSASAENVAIADDPKFSADPFVTARSVSIGVEILPLIFSKTLHVRSFRLQDPEVTLRRSAAGTWNFASLGATSGSASDTPAAGSSSGMSVAIDRMAITKGRITVEAPGGRGQSRAYDNLHFNAGAVS